MDEQRLLTCTSMMIALFVGSESQMTVTYPTALEVIVVVHNFMLPALPRSSSYRVIIAIFHIRNHFIGTFKSPVFS